MSKQNTTTRIQFTSDFKITAAGMKLSPDSRLAMACAILGKDITNYTHLDQGRRSMTALNLLRGAARKDITIVDRVEGFVRDVVAREGEHVPARKSAGKKAKAPALPALVWPKSARFQFAHLEGGEWVYTYTRKTETDTTRN